MKDQGRLITLDLKVATIPGNSNAYEVQYGAKNLSGEIKCKMLPPNGQNRKHEQFRNVNTIPK